MIAVVSMAVLAGCIFANASGTSTAGPGKDFTGYPYEPVPFTSVKVHDAFWGKRLDASRKVTVPLAFSKCEESGRYANFVKAVHPNDTIKVEGLPFDDTDVYKTIESQEL